MKKAILMAALLTTTAFIPKSFADTTLKNITDTTSRERTILSQLVRVPAEDIEALEIQLTGTFPTMTSHHGFDEVVNAFTDNLAYDVAHKFLNHPESDARLNTPRANSQPWWASDQTSALPQQVSLLNTFLQANQLKSDVSLYNILEKSMTVDPGFCDGDTRRQRPQNCEYHKTLIFLPLTNGTRLIKGYRVYWY
ncbi:hypothetical protein DOM22_16465 [Bdellovibrio sp. ZAP7]|uniref:hypothetical protein n=1 Tax=Bdellovibrio sp. ZAP7 TaxID=2231053 RepID=UPI00115A46E7|nr:hypothetical protein [Bdellovibrio sp. ZAP7]QDK46635.1 hypothetical protein DOM22_16465 [Bdellovibrio sp. ZAP7]